MYSENTRTSIERKESTAEHSWSACMIIMLLSQELKQEFPDFDELKSLKLALIHDLVEIYAGDVIAFDEEMRKSKVIEEQAALEKLISISPSFGEELSQLWHEFEANQTIEAKIAKAADAICPIFLRLQFQQSYHPINISLEDLERNKSPYLRFSTTFEKLFENLKADLLAQDLINKQ